MDVVRSKIYDLGDNIEVTSFAKIPLYDNEEKTRGRKKRKHQKMSASKWYRNRDKSINKLRRYLKKYFGRKDHYVTLTYKVNPISVDVVYKQVKNYIRILKRICKENGVELRYIYIVEQGDETGRYHIHIFINGEVLEKWIKEAWKFGNVWIEKVPTNAKELHRIAKYSLKHNTYENYCKRKGNKHGWGASENIKAIKAEKDDRLINEEDLRMMVDSPEKAEEIFERKFPGYNVVHIKQRINPFTGSPYLSIMLQRKELVDCA